MGTLHDKLKYLAEAVNDIQLAINEKKVKVDSKVPLGDYGDKIRAIQTGNLWADYVTIEAFPSFTVDDLVAKDVKDITDDVILGTVDGFNSQDCISIEVANVPFTEKDLIAKDIEDVTDNVIVGDVNGLNSKDYITVTSANFAFTVDDLVAKDVSDETDNMTIIEKQYTNI